MYRRAFDLTSCPDGRGRAAACPERLTPLLLSRSRVGQTYGLHVDDALMQGIRTDLSFTLFLSDPATYDGGALEIEDNFAPREIRLNPGDLILYPSTTLHRVTPVTRGERLATVGWVQSLIRTPEQREVLFDLGQSPATLEQAGAARPVIDRLSKARSNLLRLWAAGRRSKGARLAAPLPHLAASARRSRPAGRAPAQPRRAPATTGPIESGIPALARERACPYIRLAASRLFRALFLASFVQAIPMEPFLFAANLIFVATYLVNDLLRLRLLSIVATACLVVYFSAQPQPMPAVVGWNLF